MKNILKKKFYLYLVILILGIASSFSLPPYNYFFLNFLIFPILLYVLINIISGRFNKFLIGWIFGFGYFISNIYWITNSLTFDNKFKILIPISLILIPSFLGLFYGLITFLTSFFNLKNKISSILIFSLLFGSVEYLRSFIFGGFPWNLTVFSLSNNLSSIQILSYIGTYSLNLLTITIFTLPVIVFFNYNNRIKLITLFFSFLLIITNIAYGKYNIQKFQVKNHKNLESIVRIISPNVPIERFLTQQDPNKNILELIKLSDPDKSKNIIFIFPEGIVSGIYSNDLKIFKKLFKENYSYNHKIILGINDYDNEKIFNSLVVLNANMDQLFKYFKNKLVPFGEFLPFEKYLNQIGIKKITQGYKSFSAGNKREIFQINKLKFLPLICYEIIYSGKINSQKKNYDFILNISEDGWFGKSIGLQQHLTHSIFRSIEEGKNVIRATNNGFSAFINPKGQIIKMILDKGYIEENTFKFVDKTYFATNGNKIFFYFVLFYITLIFFLKIRENK